MGMAFGSRVELTLLLCPGACVHATAEGCHCPELVAELLIARATSGESSTPEAPTPAPAAEPWAVAHAPPHASASEEILPADKASRSDVVRVIEGALAQYAQLQLVAASTSDVAVGSLRFFSDTGCTAEIYPEVSGSGW